MTSEPTDDLEVLRRELTELGIGTGASPEDFGLEFRSPESFFGSEDAVEVPVETKAGPPRRLRRWLAPSVALAAAVVVGVVSLVPGADGPDGGRPPNAPVTPDLVTVAQVVQRAAEVSGGSPDLTDAPYWRVTSIQQQGTDPAERRTVWFGRSGPGLVIDDFSRADLPPGIFGLENGPISWDELLALPTDPRSLRKVLDREVDDADLDRLDYFVVRMAAQLLAEAPAPPELRKALWTVIGTVPGATFRGLVRDDHGRTGYGLVFDFPGRAALELIVDPASGSLLQSIATTPGRSDAITNHAVYLTQGPAYRLPAATVD